MNPFGTELPGEAEAGVEEVGGKDVHAAQLQQTREHQADGSLPRHEHVVARQQRQAFYGLKHGVDRFQHGAFFERVPGRDFNHSRQHEGHDAHVFGESAAGRFKTGGDAGLFILGALSEGVVPAEMAFHAGHVMVQGDAVADLKAAREDARPTTQAASNLYNGAGGFVAEDARRRDSAVVDLLDVGRTDAACGNADQQFVLAEARDGHSFGAEIVRAAVDGSAHGFGNREHGIILTTDGHG